MSFVYETGEGVECLCKRTTPSISLPFPASKTERDRWKGEAVRTSSTPAPLFALVSTYPASPSSSAHRSASSLSTSLFSPPVPASPSADTSPLFPTSKISRSSSPHDRRSESHPRQLVKDWWDVSEKTSSAPPAPR